MSVRFNVKTASSAAIKKLSKDLDMPEFICNVLATRGIDTPDKANAFFNPKLDYDWNNPYDIPGMNEIVNKLEEAIHANKHILVFGDFDLDGISATTVLTRFLKKLNVKVTPYIPDRFEEGYGITNEAIERILALEEVPDLIVTVDCGISCKEEVKTLLSKGIDVCVTDHHEPGNLVPEGIPIIDPKMTGPKEDSILAGVGVALKLVQALGGRFGIPHYWKELTDFATLGTIADLMPMIGENRALVRYGLDKMNKQPRPCLKALFTVAEAKETITSTSLSFSAIPRLNAAGRMGQTGVALNLLLEDNYPDALLLAQNLESINTKRRQIEADLAAIAKEQAQEIYHGQRVLIVSGENWHEGVKGIVASRLVSTYGVPTLLFSIEGNEARGSGRSVGNINLFKAVESVSDLTIRFGGHEAAVGVTVALDKLPEFSKRLNEYLEKLPESSFHPPIEIDSLVKPSELTLESVALLDKLSPFGHDNSIPVFLAQNVTMLNKRAVGADKNHFSCQLSDGIGQVSAIMFNCSNLNNLMDANSVVCAAFTLQIDEWRGQKSVKAMLKNVVPAQSCAALEACMSPKAVSFVSSLYASSDEDLCADAKDSTDDIERFENLLDTNRKHWEQVAKNNPENLKQNIIKAIIGDAPLHTSQIQVLNFLEKGKSVFSIMATGRGKSLTFQVQAVLRALKYHEASVFIYPLRALISDQQYHLNSIFNQFGIKTSVLTGETSHQMRLLTFEELERGEVDIILTTPEFFTFHFDEFANAKRIGFVAVDEAHHIGESSEYHRPMYSHLGEEIKKLNSPVVLSLTATADKKVASAIKSNLGYDVHVFDASSRPNLHVDDQRFINNKDDYLAHIVARGEKTIIYVNSRSESIVLARKLRHKVPQLASQIGFYNAGLTRIERGLVENLFRAGDFCTLIATSAFGEGVNISDVRHVVLYNLPFNEIEFNQMSGRAGRDGKPAVVHLLFNANDKQTNREIILRQTPGRDELAMFYRKLRACQRQHTGEYITISVRDFAKEMQAQTQTIDENTILCGLSVFSELQLIEALPDSEQNKNVWRVKVFENTSKVNLQDSVRLQEGNGEAKEFNSFCKWVFNASVEEILNKISKPITPTSSSI